MTAGAFDDAPTLRDARFLIRPLSEDDRTALAAAASDPEIWAGHPQPDRWRADVFDSYFSHLIASGGAVAIIDRAAGEIVGCSRYYTTPDAPEDVAIGFTFLTRAHWGGAANRAVKTLMIDHAFGWFDAVWFHIGPDNIRSQKATAKLGARYIRTGRLALSGPPKETMFFRLTREDWRTRRV